MKTYKIIAILIGIYITSFFLYFSPLFNNQPYELIEREIKTLPVNIDKSTIKTIIFKNSSEASLYVGSALTNLRSHEDSKLKKILVNQPSPNECSQEFELKQDTLIVYSSIWTIALNHVENIILEGGSNIEIVDFSETNSANNKSINIVIKHDGKLLLQSNQYLAYNITAYNHSSIHINENSKKSNSDYRIQIESLNLFDNSRLNLNVKKIEESDLFAMITKSNVQNDSYLMALPYIKTATGTIKRTNSVFEKINSRL